MSVMMWFFKNALSSLSGQRKSWKNSVSRAVGEMRLLFLNNINARQNVCIKLSH
jgi:hypothetical protein